MFDSNPGGVYPRVSSIKVLAEASWYDGRIRCAVKRWKGQRAEVRHCSHFHLINVTTFGGTTSTIRRVSGYADYVGRDRPGVVSFGPAGTERYGRYENPNLEYVALYVDPKISPDGFGRDIAPLRTLDPFTNRRESVVAAILSRVSQELKSGFRPDAAFIEHALALTTMCFTRASNRPVRETRVKLSDRILKYVGDYIEESLATDLSVSELAEVAEMPQDAFSRAFKSSTGLAPYQYVLERRVRRAETLLRTSQSSLASIAYEVGFSSQSHMTTTFRRLSGMTPGALREGLANGSSRERPK